MPATDNDIPGRDSTDAADASPPRRSTESESPPPSSSGGLEEWKKALREMAPYLDLGWRLAGATAGPPLIGYFLVDLWFGTAPWGVLAGCVLGLAAAGLQLKRLQDEFGH